MIDEHAKVIWEYMLLHHRLAPSDLIFVLGSRDERVAGHAAELFKQGMAPMVLVSGGIAHRKDLLAATWGAESEATHFASIMQRAGVPAEAIILEEQAANTGENIRLGYKLLEELGRLPRRLILVQKPYMERRTYATFRKQWPIEGEVRVASPPIPYERYFNEEQPKDTVINIMVGDLQRIVEYPKLGFQIP